AASRASDVADSAARAGVVAGGVPGPDGTIAIDESAARAAAVEWLAREHVDAADSDVTVTPDLVRVVVRMSRQTTLLRLAGVTELHVQRTGAARAATGITKEGA
ncbi:MAG TPA: pilus assembly protein, partial [Acidimicrobiia bacterium]|nr:pilus assembly protein [Acidimicrobiia bacterium]